MRVVNAVLRVLIGAIFGVGCVLALSPALAALMKDGPPAALAVSMIAVVVVSALLGLFAPTIRRAFGRAFLLLGVCVLALPLSVLLLSGRVMSEMAETPTANEGARVLGAGLGATLMTGVAGFLGFFLGAIFIIAGLVLALGGRREVIVVEKRGRAEPSV